MAMGREAETPVSRKRRTAFPRNPASSLLMSLLRLVEAFRHVRSKGQTTRRRAVARAARPPDRCPTCRQDVPHSPDWRDHVHDDLPGRARPSHQFGRDMGAR
jgi:hypothetical protein